MKKLLICMMVPLLLLITINAVSAADKADLQMDEGFYTNQVNYDEENYYYLTVTNNGPNDAHNVETKVTSIKKEDIFYWAYTYDDGETWSYQGSDFNPDTRVWNVGTLKNQQQGWLDIGVKLKKTGKIKESSSVSGTEFDPNPFNNEASMEIDVKPAADIQINQTTNTQQPNQGETIILTIEATNNGPDQATNVEVKDLLPTSLTYVSNTASQGTYNSLTGFWTVGNLNKDAKATLLITAIATIIGTTQNTALKTQETQYDWNTTNDYQTVTINILPVFTNKGSSGGTINKDDGSTTKIDLPFTVNLYGNTYNQMYISVNGLISFNQALPMDNYDTTPTNYVAYIAPMWSDVDVTYNGSIYYTLSNTQATITWNMVPSYSQHENPQQYPPAYNTYSVIITRDGKFAFIYGDLQWKNDPSNSYPSYSRINKGDTTTFKNFWTGAQGLNELANKTIWFDSNGNIIAPTQYADIAITQQASDSRPKKNTIITITLTARNNGPSTATGVQVTDLLPTLLSFQSYTATQGTYNPTTGIWDIGSINSGQSAIMTITVYVNDLPSASNTATKTAETEFDPVATNNAATLTIRPK